MRIHENIAVNLPPECSRKRLLIDESASPTHIRRRDGAERDASDEGASFKVRFQIVSL